MKNKGLTFETLYKKLNLTNAIYQPNTKDAPINSGKLLIKCDQTFEPESVYIGMVSDLPKTLLTDDVINLICIRDAELSELVIKKPAINLIIVDQKITLPELLNKVQSILQTFQKYVLKCNAIISSLMKNDDLQSMIDLSYDMLGNPISLVDVSMKLLVYTKNVVVDDLLWNELIAEKYPSNKTMLAFTQEKYFSRLTHSNKPFIAEAGRTFKIRRILGKLIVDKKMMGYITVLESNQPFKEEDLDLIELICVVIANKIAMQKKLLIYSDNMMFEDLFIDMLENKVRDKEIILERLKYLEWKDSDKYHVFTVDIAKIDKTNSIIYYLKSSIQALSNSPHVVVHDKHIVIIIGSKKENQFRIENFESIVYFMKQNKLFAGLSKSFTNISDLHKYYKQSIKSIEFGLMLGNGEDNLFIYEDYSIFHLIQICSKQSDIMDFCHPSLLQLIDYDKNNDADYYKSLEAFIMHDLNLSDAAETIFIHRITMSYRITKIKNLTGINLNDKNMIMQLFISFKLLEYLKMME